MKKLMAAKGWSLSLFTGILVSMLQQGESQIRAIIVRFICVVLLVGLWPLQSFSQTGPKIHSITLGPAKATLDHWTSQRLQSAVPVEPPVQGDPQDELSLALPEANSAASGAFVNGASIFTRFAVYPFLYDGTLPDHGTCCYPYSTIGKLFVTKPNGSGGTCTASVVRPHLLLTARHCIYDVATKKFFSNVIFYPGWNMSSGPNPFLRTWIARALTTWDSNTSIKWDIAFIQTYDDIGFGCGGSSSRPIESYTGTLGALSSPNEEYFDRQWNQFGYPGQAPFNGQSLIEVQSGTHFRGSTTIKVTVANDMTPGSSGGPWIFGFDTIGGGFPGGNFANGLNSQKPPGRPDLMESPRFLTDNFDALLVTAENCPGAGAVLAGNGR